jgi:hypothetical protein
MLLSVQLGDICTMPARKFSSINRHQTRFFSSNRVVHRHALHWEISIRTQFSLYLASKIILHFQRLSLSSSNDGIDEKKHCESTLILESTTIIVTISLFFFRSIDDDDGKTISIVTSTIIVVFSVFLFGSIDDDDDHLHRINDGETVLIVT